MVLLVTVSLCSNCVVVLSDWDIERISMTVICPVWILIIDRVEPFRTALVTLVAEKRCRSLLYSLEWDLLLLRVDWFLPVYRFILSLCLGCSSFSRLIPKLHVWLANDCLLSLAILILRDDVLLKVVPSLAWLTICVRVLWLRTCTSDIVLVVQVVLWTDWNKLIGLCI